MALVTSPFLSAVASCTWSSSNGGCLIDPTGAIVFPTAAPTELHNGLWSLAPKSGNAHIINQGLAAQLSTSRAEEDGSFVTATGRRFWLGVNGSAVEDAPYTGPPPPPP
jgi:hypothetical protein